VNGNARGEPRLRASSGDVDPNGDVVGKREPELDRELHARLVAASGGVHGFAMIGTPEDHAGNVAGVVAGARDRPARWS
jgi:hypothetical protein